MQSEEASFQTETENDTKAEILLLYNQLYATKFLCLECNDVLLLRVGSQNFNRKYFIGCRSYPTCHYNSYQKTKDNNLDT